MKAICQILALKRQFAAFIAARGGSIAIIAGLMLPLCFGVVAVSIEYSYALNTKFKVQTQVDAATLAIARALRDGSTADEATEHGKNFFKESISQVSRVNYTADFKAVEDLETGIITAESDVTLTYDPLFSAMLLPEGGKMLLASEASLQKSGNDLYLVLLIDATGSMWNLISSVQAAALSLEASVRDELLKKDIEIGKFFLKVAYYRDLLEDSDAWVESPVYDMGDPNSQGALKSFVTRQYASGGADIPESGFAAIGEVLTEPLPSTMDPDNLFQAIMLWSDAASNSLGSQGLWTLDWYGYLYSGYAQEDITVKLYKTYGTNAKYYEDLYYDGDATGQQSAANTPAYGCCSTDAVLEDVWENYGLIPVERRSMGLFVPQSQVSWQKLANWTNVTMKEYSQPSAASLVDDIVKTIGDKKSPLVLKK